MIEIIEKDIGHVLEIEARIPLWKMAKIMGNNYSELMDYIAVKGAESSDVPYARYLNVNWEEELSKGKFAMFLEIFSKKWHLCCGIPVKSVISSEKHIQANVIKKTSFVKAIHRGPYHHVGKTYTKMLAWTRQNSLEVENTSYEFYMNDPNETRRKDLETIVLIPVSQ